MLQGWFYVTLVEIRLLSGLLSGFLSLLAAPLRPSITLSFLSSWNAYLWNLLLQHTEPISVKRSRRINTDWQPSDSNTPTKLKVTRHTNWNSVCSILEKVSFPMSSEISIESIPVEVEEETLTKETMWTEAMSWENPPTCTQPGTDRRWLNPQAPGGNSCKFRLER